MNASYRYIGDVSDSIKGYLNKSVSMKDLGEAAYIFGINIDTSPMYL